MSSIAIETNKGRFYLDDITNAKCRLIDNRQPVLFLGEADFSFSTAIAAARGSWWNVLATNFQDRRYSAEESIQANIAEIQDPQSLIHRRYHPNCRPQSIARLKHLYRCKGRPLRKYDIDATGDIDQQIFDAGCTPGYWSRNLFFQCPWVPSRYDPVGPGKLIRDFLDSASYLQKSGDYAFVGIANHPSFVKKYNLSSLIRGRDRVNDFYELVGGDKSLVREALAHGYRHSSRAPNVNRLQLHDHLFDSHVTLCFMRY